MTHPGCKHVISGSFIACGELGYYCSAECQREANNAYVWQVARWMALLIACVAVLKGCP